MMVKKRGYKRKSAWDSSDESPEEEDESSEESDDEDLEEKVPRKPQPKTGPAGLTLAEKNQNVQKSEPTTGGREVSAKKGSSVVCVWDVQKCQLKNRTLKHLNRYDCLLP